MRIGTGIKTLLSGGGVLVAALILSGCPKENLVNIPLEWKPTTTFAKMKTEGGVVEADSANSNPVNISISPFKDTRSNAALIAENREKSTEIKPATTKDSVAIFVTKQFGAVLQEAGLQVLPSGGVATINGEIEKFFVTETDTYEGIVTLKLQVVRGGKTVWSGTVTGTATRFGRSYSAENYYETLSDSLYDGVYKLSKNAAFQKALQK